MGQSNGAGRSSVAEGREASVKVDADTGEGKRETVLRPLDLSQSSTTSYLRTETSCCYGLF